MNRWTLAAGLMVLSPMCAEYVQGYDTSTGNPAELIGGLFIFVPLYGAPALLIREMARRFGVGWPGILALGLAFGLIQAGVVDQSLFSDSYREIDGWDAAYRATLIEPLGLSASNAVNFLAGHAIWSFAIPIALVESLRPALSKQPWLRLPGTIGVSLLYVAAAAFVLDDSLANEKDHASPWQIIGSLVVVAVLVAVAFTAGQRTRPLRDAAVPNPLVIGLLSLVAAFAFNSIPESWPGVAAGVTLLTAGAVSVSHLSRSSRWNGRHIAALATGALVARAAIGFFATPLGNVPTAAKYAHNVAFLAGALLLGAWAARRLSRG